MKIAFIGGRDLQTLGGIESYVYNLATQLVKMGHEPIVFCESDRDSVEWCNGFKIIRQKSVGGKFLCKILLSYRATLRLLLSKEKVDVFHYNAWPPSLACWLPRLFGKVAVLQGHGLEWKRTKYTSWQQKIIKFMMWLTAKMNNHLTMVSQEQSDYFKVHANKDCVTIPTATPIPKFPIKSNILDRFDIPEYKYFLFLGRLEPGKNADYLIKAFIQANFVNQYLVIAGDNDALPAYVKDLHELAVGHNNIVFTNAVAGDDKEKLLEKCFAFCLPSTSEGLSITLLEAMSYGKVCIASDIEANHEGLGDSGIWCKYEDVKDLKEKLIYSVEHYDEVKWQEAYNLNRFKTNFTWEIVSQRYNDFINSIAKK